VILADGTSLTVIARSDISVRALLEKMEIPIGRDDEVEPDLWREVENGMTITVTRVEYGEETEVRPLPFRQRVIRSEAMPAGERKLLQLGSEGREEIVYRLVIKDGQVAEREEVLRHVAERPVDEIIAIGIVSDLPSVPISGTLAYVSGGNAWVMRGTSGSRRPLTSWGDLDGRVMALSPDGDWLVFSRVEPDAPERSLNSLWIVGTTILNEEPQPLGIQGVVYAEWFSDGRRLLYSAAERSGSSPGWRAHNDLWQADISGLKPAGRRTGGEVITATSTLLWEAASDEVYGWWGTNFALSSDDRRVAFGRPHAIGLIDLWSGSETVLLEFAVYHTYGDWVWLPELSWSPDGRFIASSAHGQPKYGGRPEESPFFDMWVLDRLGMVQALMAEEAGMWAAPHWSPARAAADGRAESFIVYGVARNPRDSHSSRYDLYVMDRDGSNRMRIFPPAGWEGVVAPDLAWSPAGWQLAVAHDGHIYLVDALTAEVTQLTADGHSAGPRWAGRQEAPESRFDRLR